ncbi:unnamed protein product [Psylliodes chrysocephalus]|uniref:Uncharacterized protein n=1 Tax=Psylliodes chrysocephalus TaxID=3402493 RepID=A0A9P0G441_9CUCU|nr:unnamed protein product [Psylliodes chrysocephala]
MDIEDNNEIPDVADQNKNEDIPNVGSSILTKKERGQRKATDKMVLDTKNILTELKVKDMVTIAIPKVDRGPLDTKNIIGTILRVKDCSRITGMGSEFDDDNLLKAVENNEINENDIIEIQEEAGSSKIKVPQKLN